MFKHDLEKIGSAVSKHSENIRGFWFSAKNLAENPKKFGGVRSPGSPAFWMYVLCLYKLQNVFVLIDKLYLSKLTFVFVNIVKCIC